MIAIGYASPLLVVIFAAMFLGENVRLFRLSMVVLGLLGVLIVLSPQLDFGASGIPDYQRTLGAVVTLGGACCAALAQIFVRKLVQEERTSAIVFWFSVTSTALGLLTLPFGWVMPAAGTLALLITTGILGGIGQIFLTSAYRYGEASLVAPSNGLDGAVGGHRLVSVRRGRDPHDAVRGVAGDLAGILIIWREHSWGWNATASARQ